MPDKTSCSGKDLTDLCHKSIDHIDRAQDLPRVPLGKEIHQATMQLIKLRDCLIERLRADASAAASIWREPLDQVNQAVSLLTGVAFPSSGINRKYMEDARKILSEVRKSIKPV